MAAHFPTVSWASKAVLYEANIRQYSIEGNFHSFANHLPRLKKMGVDIIWVMPITPISEKVRQGTLGSYYACSSYDKINPEFGTLQDFKTLVQAAHELGMKVIIDWVANHTGWDHHWANENPDWYVLDEAGNFTEKNGWHDVIDLNFSNSEMRNGLIKAMKFWVSECDIDGFRCDMAHLVPLDFWVDARQQCDALKPLFWLAECEEVQYHNVFDTSYAWAFMHAIDNYSKGNGSLNNMRNVLHDYSHYPQGSKKLFFTTNHDENSWNGTEYEKYGNNAKAFAVLTFTWNGMPLIYSGQETAHKNRLKFFDKDLITWANPLPLEKFYTILAQLHKSSAINKGETFVLPTSNDFVMAYLRKSVAEVILVILNLSNHDRVKVEVSHSWLRGNFSNSFSKLNYDFNENETFELMANDYIIYQNF